VNSELESLSRRIDSPASACTADQIEDLVGLLARCQSIHDRFEQH
jgi:hypothetical protein